MVTISHHFPRFLAAFVAAAISFTGMTTFAQDGTGGSAPETMMRCEIVISTSAESESATPVASPLASPVASPAATPVASPVVEVDTDPLTEDLTAASESILTCMSENNVEVLTNITGQQFRGSWLGFGVNIDDADFAAILPMMPQLPYELISVQEATQDDESATATVIYTAGRQMLTAEWTFSLVTVDRDQVWQVENEQLQPSEAPANSGALDLTIDDGSFKFSPATIQATDIVIDVTNTGTQPHEVLILRVPAGMDERDIAAAPTGIPDGATFVAQATVPAGAEGTIVLTKVKSGEYTVVDLLPDASGMPNVSSGMITTFEVTKP